MDFQKKMISVFSVLLLVVSIIFGLIYYCMMEKHYIQTEETNIQAAADNYAQQFSSTIGQMQEVIQQILSNQDVLEAIKILSFRNSNSTNVNAYYSLSKNTVRVFLNSDYYKRNFNRVVHFMQNGTVVSGTNYEYNPVDSNKTIQDITWLDKVEGKRGEYIILGAHKDDWVNENAKYVISVVKQIVGENLGYIEVQKDIDLLDVSYVPASKNWNLYIYHNNECVYSSNREAAVHDEGVAYKYVKKIQSEDEKSDVYYENGYLVSVSRTYGDGIYAVIINRSPVLHDAIFSALPITVLMVGIMVGISFIYIYIMARHMVRPIHQLKDEMEKTDISNLVVCEPIEISDKEIKKLYDSYRGVLVKLDQSIQKERFLSELQKKAQFDLLQAQVNPHFLFNVLNVISSRGVYVEDEVICDICADLAQMLRYSTDVKEKRATLEEEISYLKKYLSLLKFRYEDMLEYDIHVDERMCKLKFPKMALQQLVENSIAHGYTNVDRVRKIQVSGEYAADFWCIHVKDNGVGIAENTKKEIYQKCDDIKLALSDQRSHVEMSIGGMGIVNTYARLYEIYGNAFFMKIHDSDVGAHISIGVNL